MIRLLKIGSRIFYILCVYGLEKLTLQLTINKTTFYKRTNSPQIPFQLVFNVMSRNLNKTDKCCRAC
jgi:hypothetical protein